MGTRIGFIRRLAAYAPPLAVSLALGACASQPGPGSPGVGAASGAAPAAPSVTLPALKPTQPPADLDPTERFAWQQTVQLGEAFAAGDAEGFLARVSRGFYRGYSQLEASLRGLLADTSARSAVVAVRRITEDAGRVSVRAEWTRSVTRRDGSVEARLGETEFLFLKSDTSLRLLDYRGDAPFAIPGL